MPEQMRHPREMEKVVAASPDKQVSLTDPGDRAMTSSGRGSTMVGYSVQAAVDTTHHLIVAHEVTNANQRSGAAYAHGRKLLSRRRAGRR